MQLNRTYFAQQPYQRFGHQFETAKVSTVETVPSQPPETIPKGTEGLNRDEATGLLVLAALPIVGLLGSALIYSLIPKPNPFDGRF